jgi:peptidoglycan/xylan/chitin deacetylase (PgdA/CDA1 family)
MVSTRWPNGAKAAISFTMDNLGEAQDVNRGVWPADVPVGSHSSVKEKLPRMINMLDKYGVRATYFAESWSLGVYPDAVRSLSARGHEIAWHGYQHEVWHSLSREDEILNFHKSFEESAKYGIRYKGFRPPGGSINDRTYDLLREYGVKYVSPLGKLGIENGIVVLPFEWKTVDAFYYMEKFAGIRESQGEQKYVLAPSNLETYLLSRIGEVIESGGYISILFHPFLQTSEEKFAVMEKILARISHDEELWCAPCGEVADWVAEHSSMFR